VSTFFGYTGQPTEMGLAILAGALGLAFGNLEKFSEFSGAGFSAKMKEQVQAVLEKETENTPAIVQANSALVQDKTPEFKVLQSLADPKYTWRTLSGISKAAELIDVDTWKYLVQLIQKDLVRVGNKNKTGEMIWALTPEGRQVVSAHT